MNFAFSVQFSAYYNASKWIWATFALIVTMVFALPSTKTLRFMLKFARDKFELIITMVVAPPIKKEVEEMTWLSEKIPDSIRRPWTFYYEDLAERMGEKRHLQGWRITMKEAFDQLYDIQNRGLLEVFQSMPEEKQRVFVDHSL